MTANSLTDIAGSIVMLVLIVSTCDWLLSLIP
jgi:hypothetical protein